MSIYDNPRIYASKTRISLGQAVERCRHFKSVEKEVYGSRKCPKCGANTLKFMRGYEGNGSDVYIYCDNDEAVVLDGGVAYLTRCSFTSILDTVSQSDGGFDFDVVLMFSDEIDSGSVAACEDVLGVSWSEFVKEDTRGLKSRVALR